MNALLSLVDGFVINFVQIHCKIELVSVNFTFDFIAITFDIQFIFECN